ncbi:hypothetical protein PR003_g20297 [Phytophthora rubi]|uniref:Uncharacterized protein n=1 Tax=Phytophthora rubi TaxID=129364 RepID=A0A6A3JKJ2_9STRA|nr:hypothetical protein PR002_g19721 [Phytophthora rubi]KAE9310325.1 hypothetical protein PR003_g20297 [Phytophthora rubi]
MHVLVAIGFTVSRHAPAPLQTDTLLIGSLAFTLHVVTAFPHAARRPGITNCAALACAREPALPAGGRWPQRPLSSLEPRTPPGWALPSGSWPPTPSRCAPATCAGRLPPPPRTTRRLGRGLVHGSLEVPLDLGLVGAQLITTSSMNECETLRLFINCTFR